MHGINTATAPIKIRRLLFYKNMRRPFLQYPQIRSTKKCILKNRCQTMEWDTRQSSRAYKKKSFKARRPRLNVPGYFWIRNFFFPNSKISLSTHPMASRFTDLEKLRRPEVRRPHVIRFVADFFFFFFFFFTAEEWFKRISGFAVEFNGCVWTEAVSGE